jgi:hypothetical protein
VPLQLVRHRVVHAVAVRRDVLDGQSVARQLGQDHVRLDLPRAHRVLVLLLDALAALALLLLLLLSAPLRLGRLRWRGRRGRRSRNSRSLRLLALSVCLLISSDGFQLLCVAALHVRFHLLHARVGLLLAQPVLLGLLLERLDLALQRLRAGVSRRQVQYTTHSGLTRSSSLWRCFICPGVSALPAISPRLPNWGIPNARGAYFI